MIALPEDGSLLLWRLDQAIHADTWSSGIGAEIAGGRWNSRGRRVVYGAADAATAILEVAVHKGFRALDKERHRLTCARIHDARLIPRIRLTDLPNANWLSAGPPSRDQQLHGDQLLAKHAFILVPSVVCRYSWNILMNPQLAAERFELVSQDDFALDTRLNPPG